MVSIKRLFFIVSLVVFISFLTVFYMMSNNNYDANSLDVASKEYQELVQRINNNSGITIMKSNHYSISAKVSVKNSDNIQRIIYEVTVSKPKIKMKEVSISVHLHPYMETKLNTSNVFFTNIYDVENNDDFTLEPNGNTKGINVGRAFILDPKQIDKQFLNIYRICYVKVTWTSGNGKRQSDFFRLESEVSNELNQYLKNKSL